MAGSVTTGDDGTVKPMPRDKLRKRLTERASYAVTLTGCVDLGGFPAHGGKQDWAFALDQRCAGLLDCARNFRSGVRADQLGGGN